MLLKFRQLPSFWSDSSSVQTAAAGMTSQSPTLVKTEEAERGHSAGKARVPAPAAAVTSCRIGSGKRTYRGKPKKEIRPWGTHVLAH